VLEALFDRATRSVEELPSRLAELYGGGIGFEEPCLYANFVATIDGVVAIPSLERSNALIAAGSDGDRFLMGLLRAFADVVLIGAGTLAASPRGTWQPHRVYPAAADELAELLDVVKPRHLVPVHGEYRHLALHRRIAERSGMASESIHLVEDGDVLELSAGTPRRAERVPMGTILVDGIGVGDVGPVVLRDRKVLAEDGFLLCVVTIDARTGEVLAGPDLISRGFVHVDEARDLLDDAAERVAEALDDLDPDVATEWGAIKKACRRSLGEFIWRSTQRRPMILPVIMEV
jgi:hypothetical protein